MLRQHQSLISKMEDISMELKEIRETVKDNLNQISELKTIYLKITNKEFQISE